MQKLTPKMEHALRNLAAGRPSNDGLRGRAGWSHGSTLEGLRSRELLDDHDQLTDEGRKVATELPSP